MGSSWARARTDNVARRVRTLPQMPDLGAHVRGPGCTKEIAAKGIAGGAGGSCGVDHTDIVQMLITWPSTYLVRGRLGVRGDAGVPAAPSFREIARFSRESRARLPGKLQNHCSAN